MRTQQFTFTNVHSLPHCIIMSHTPSLTHFVFRVGVCGIQVHPVHLDVSQGAVLLHAWVVPHVTSVQQVLVAVLAVNVVAAGAVASAIITASTV